MIHCFPVVTDHPELHLAQGDVLIIELDAHEPAVRYRALPLNFVGILPILLAQGIISSSLTFDDLACLASGTEPPTAAACLAPRGEPDRRQDERRQIHLRLLSAGE